MVTPPAPAEIECGPGAAAAEAAWLDAATALDSCQGARPVVRQLLETVPGCPGEEVRRWRFSADDGCGNLAEEIAELTIRDRVAPALSGVPSDATVECPAVPPPAAVTATDACGNSASSSQRLTVVDTVAPSLSGVPADATVSCDAIPLPAVVSASDACDPSPALTFVESVTPGACPQARLLTRTWTATDACGNATTQSQRLTVVDAVAPSLAGVPADATVECTAIPAPATVTASDACDPSPGLTFVESVTPGACPQERLLTRTWTATDACGNAASRSQRLTVVDSAAPILSGVPADARVSCASVPAAPAVTAADSCDPAPIVALVETRIDDPSCADRYTLVRTWTATDACGNAASAAQVLTVTDDVPPVISGVPSDATVSCDSIPPAPFLTARDDCGPNQTVIPTETSVPGTCPNERTITRTWATSDRCGNAAVARQVLQVVDTTPPVLSPPGDPVVECPAPPAGPGSEAAWIASASATDTCGPATVQSLELVREPGCGGTLRVVREFWALDACGLSSPHVTREYRVVDTTPPVLVPPGDAVVECPAPSTGPGSEAAWIAAASASDACGPASVQSVELLREPGCGGTLRVVREFWALDACGLTSPRATREYRVVDTTPPAFSVAGTQFEVSLWPPNHGYVVFATADVASAADLCSAVTVRATGCASDQPEDVHQGRTDDGGNGDGRFAEDCVLAADGSAFAVRAERLGACGKDSRRTYVIELTATDECGNVARAPGRAVVQHDRSGHDDVLRGDHLPPTAPPPFPYVHPTVYGPGCGTR